MFDIKPTSDTLWLQINILSIFIDVNDDNMEVLVHCGKSTLMDVNEVTSHMNIVATLY